MTDKTNIVGIPAEFMPPRQYDPASMTAESYIMASMHIGVDDLTRQFRGDLPSEMCDGEDRASAWMDPTIVALMTMWQRVKDGTWVMDEDCMFSLAK